MLCLYDLFVFRRTYLKKVLFTVMLKIISIKTVLPPQPQSMLMHVCFFILCKYENSLSVYLSVCLSVSNSLDAYRQVEQNYA